MRAAAAPAGRGAAKRAPTRTPLERSSVEPLYRQLATRLLEAIGSGSLAPGSRLPSEPALMAEHGVSRVTVRQAIALLQRNGKVAAQRGKGTFVLGPRVRHDLDALQGFHDALVGQGIEPSTRLLEFDAHAGALDEGLPAGTDLPVRLQRLYSVDGRPFALVTGWLPSGAAAIGRERAERLTVYQIVDGFLGLRVVHADVTIRSQRAPAVVARLLARPRDEHLLVMERRSITSTGRTAEFMRIHIVPERFEFRLGVPGPLEIARGLSPVARRRPRLATGVRR